MPDKPDTTNIRIATTPYRDSDPPRITTKTGKTIIEQLAADLTGLPYTEEAAQRASKLSQFAINSLRDALLTEKDIKYHSEQIFWNGMLEVGFCSLVVLGSYWVIDTLFPLLISKHIVASFVTGLTLVSLSYYFALRFLTRKENDFIFRCIRERPARSATNKLREMFAREIRDLKTTCTNLYNSLSGRILRLKHEAYRRKQEDKQEALTTLLYLMDNRHEELKCFFFKQCAERCKLFETLATRFETETDPALNLLTAERIDFIARELFARLRDLSTRRDLISRQLTDNDSNLATEVKFYSETLLALEAFSPLRFVSDEVPSDAADETDEQSNEHAPVELLHRKRAGQ